MHPAWITSVTMRVVALLVFLLVNVHQSCCCLEEHPTLFCTSIPAAFQPGYSSLIMALRIDGTINSTVLRSDSLISITRLRIQDSGVTGIAEGAFSSLQNLTILNLNKNFLKEINVNWLGRPDILQELNLAENQIEVLNESMLNGLTNLRKLRLDKNKIRSIGPNSFSSQTRLDELDLSENRMTQLSPQVFKSLESTMIRLHGNPWDCSCGAEDFVDFLKDLQNRSLLDRQMEVTCESPPSLRGRPVWDVSVCGTSPPPRPPSPAQTVHPKPPDIPTGVSTSSAPTPARPTSETKISVQPKPPGTLTTVTTSDLRPTVKPAANETSPPSVTQISVHHKPSDPPTTTPAPKGVTETSVTSPPSSDTNTVCTLAVVIAVLSSLLFMACFLVVMHWRKRQNKTVTPGCPKETRDELRDDCSRLSPAQSTEHKDKGDFPEKQHLDSELGWTRSFTGVRAKSADAVLFTSPFCAPMKEQVSLHSETESHSEDTQAAGRQKVGNDSEADGRVETENQTNTTGVRDKYAKRVAEGKNPHKDPNFVSVLADTVPYLSIGTNQNQPSPVVLNKQDSDGPEITRDAHRSHMRRVMGRISSWPPTAVQWQARCKMEKEDEDGVSDVLSVWTTKFPGETKRALNKDEQNSGSDWDREEDETEKTQTEDPLKMDVAHVSLGHSKPSKPKKKTTSVIQAHVHTDMNQEDQEEERIQEPSPERQATSQSQNLSQEEAEEERKSAEKNNSKRSSNKAEQRNEARRAVTSRQRAENRSTTSKAPSGGASPDDETLLSGNEYAFMDLLHEVVQNNGRWTRDRWKQAHANKPRR